MSRNTTNKSCTITPSERLYRDVRAGFILKGTTLTSYCRENNDCNVYARQALVGDRNGPKAREFRQRLVTAAGLIKPSGAVRQASDLLTSQAA